MVCLVGHFHLDQHVAGEKAARTWNLLAAPQLDDFLGWNKHLFKEMPEAFLGSLLLDRFRHFVLEIRVGVNDVPAFRHSVSPRLYYSLKIKSSTSHFSTASTPRKKKDARTTMISTIIVVTMVSLRDGQVTFAPSCRTC
jgi:hypothetical protein